MFVCLIKNQFDVIDLENCFKCLCCIFS